MYKLFNPEEWHLCVPGDPRQCVVFSQYYADLIDPTSHDAAYPERLC